MRNNDSIQIRETVNDEKLESLYRKNKYFIVEECYRFVILILHSTLNFSVGACWITFSAISTNFQDAFKVSNFLTDMITNTYAFSIILLSFPVCILIEKCSVYMSICLCSLLLIIGTFLRTWTSNSVIYAFIGESLCAITQPIIFNLNPKIATLWFRSSMRLIATSVLFGINTIGVVVGVYLPVICFHGNYKDDNAKWISDFNLYIKLMCYFSSGAGLLTIILFKEKPEIPPSLTSLLMEKMTQERNSQPRISDESQITITKNRQDLKDVIYQENIEEGSFNFGVIESIISLFKQKNFVIINIFFTMQVSFFNTFNTNINKILSMYSIDESKSDKLNTLNNLGGTIGIMLVMAITRFIKRYKSIMIADNFVMLAAYSSLVLLLYLGDLSSDWTSVLLYLVFIVIGISNSIGYLITIDFASENCYPIHDSIITGALFCSSQVASIVIIVINNVLIDGNLIYVVHIINIGLFVISQIMSFIVRDELVKQNIDNQQQIYED